MNGSRQQSHTLFVILSWLAAGCLHVVMFTGMYLVLSRSSPPNTDVMGRLVWNAAGLLVIATTAVTLVLKWRKPLVIALHRLCQLKVSDGGTVLLSAGLAFALTVSARHGTRLRYGETHPFDVTDLWQAATILLLVTWLALATERQKIRGAANLPSPPFGQTMLVAAGLTVLVFALAQALSLDVLASLILVAVVITFSTPLRRPMYFGVLMTIFAGILLILLSPYRRDRVFKMFVGQPHVEYGQYQWGPIYKTLQSALPFSPAEAAQRIPHGEDQLLLASLTSYVGLVPVLLFAAVIVALSCWTWLRCRHAPDAGHGRNVLRNLGLAASGLLLVSTFLSLLSNAAVLRMPYQLGIAFFSPRASMLMLATIALVAASLTPNRGHARSSSVHNGWAGPRFMATAGAMLLGTCIWRVVMINEPPLKTAATPPVRADIVDRHGHLLATTRVEETAPGVRRAVREYPAKSATAHLIGFVNDDDHGQEGLELTQDERLRAAKGSIFPPSQQKPVWLTIDVDIQKAAHQALSDAVARASAKAGAVVVLDKDGDIRALVSLPDYNADDPDLRRKLDPDGHRLFNHAIGHSFSPGPLLTPLMATSLMDSRSFGPETAMNLGPLRISDQIIRDVEDYGTLTVTQAIGKSSIVAHAKMALSMSPKHWTQLMRQLGLGDDAKVRGLAGETQGRIPADRQLTVRKLVTFGFPQARKDGKLDVDATVEVSLLQIARAYLPLANQSGYTRRANLLDENPRCGGEKVFSRESVHKTLAILEQAIGAEGTAHKATVPNIRVGGISASIRMPAVNNDPARSIGALVGLVPISDPRLVVAVMIQGREDQTLQGGEVAAPVFARIVQRMTELDVSGQSLAMGRGDSR
jgi:uncharacterized protein GlcG (DUF336 family)